MDDNEKPQRPEMGEWRVISGKAIKHRRPIDDNRSSYRDVSWERKEVEPARMMFVGYRFVKNGLYWFETDYDDYGRSYGYPCFTTKQQLEVWVFVKGVRSNPIYVFPDDACEPIEVQP